MTIHETLNPSFVAPIVDLLPDAVLWVQPVFSRGGEIEDFEIHYANKAGNLLVQPQKATVAGARMVRDGLPSREAAAACFVRLCDCHRSGVANSALVRGNTGMQYQLTCTPYAGGILATLHHRDTAGAAPDTDAWSSLQSMVDNAPIGMVLYEAMRNNQGTITDFRMLHYNQRSNELLGITAAERKRYTFRQLLEVLELGYVFEYYVAIVENGMVLHKEQYIQRLNKWLAVASVKMNDGFAVMHTDITELKSSQQALEEQTLFLNNILNTSLNAVAVMEVLRDGSGRVVDFTYRQVNSTFLKWLEKQEHEVLGQRMLAVFPATREAGIFEAYCQVVNTAAPKQLEVLYEAGAKQVWFDLAVAPLNEHTIVGTFNDISPRKQAFRQIEEQKNLLDNILRHSSNGIAVSEMIRDSQGKVVDGRTILCNDAAVRYTGIPKDLYLSKTATELDPSLPESEYYRNCIRTLEEGTPLLTQYYLHHSKRWLELSVSRMDNERLIHIFTDITPAKEAQLQLERSASTLKAVFNAAQTGMFTFTPEYDAAGEITDFRFAMVNPTIAAYVGQMPEALEGSLGSSWFPGYLTNGVFDMYKQTFLSGEPSRKEVHYHEDGHNNYLDLQCVRTSDQLLVSFTDHTDLRKVQAQLERSVEELQKMNANLEQFAYSASHDLKEPLRKINFFSERLRERMAGRMNNEERDLLDRMEKACLRMNTLIDDLLEYSRVGRGAKELEPTPLNDLVRSVLESLELSIQEKNARVTIGPLPTINGHKQQLEQLFQNLIENALKYSHPERTASLSLSWREVRNEVPGHPQVLLHPGRNYHLIEVADNGIGFDQEDADRIFQVFTRLHGRSEYAGTGVGLSIARKVVENHGGQIWATAQTGAGAVFHILFP